MSDRYIDYLKREHARLENELDRASRAMAPNQLTIARLKKLKLAVKDQIAWHERPMRADRAA
jgi:hypothetical protein